MLYPENGGNKILRNVGDKLPFFVVYLNLELTNHFIFVYCLGNIIALYLLDQCWCIVFSINTVL
jgi:hypothetical protein